MRVGRILGIPLMVMLVVAGVGLAAPIVQPPEVENLVEGHTVFTVIEQVNRNTTDQVEYAAAVAVLVREVTYKADAFRFPGVFWFNDQYLVNPKASSSSSTTYRFPCNGAVIAVPSGDPDPTVDPVNTFTQANYVESYYISDPNEYDWVVDKWVVNGRPIWTVAMNNNPAGYSTPDSGTGSCLARSDRLCAGVNVLPYNYEDRPAPYQDSGAADNRDLNQCQIAQGSGTGPVAGTRPGDNGYNYPCGGKDSAPKTACFSNIQYNAVLFFFLDDLDVVGANKDHRTGSADRANDVSGCDANSVNMSMPSYTVWPCPAANDDREGNSHAYNPGQSYPITTYAGRNNHGGSADCTGDAVGDQGCHATRLVDIYYGVAALPTRTLVVNDQEGVTAPYHCHDATPGQTPDTWCDQNDAFGSVGLDAPEPPQ